MRNIIICCDGTGNEISENISNVLKLYRCLRKTEKTSPRASNSARLADGETAACESRPLTFSACTSFSQSAGMGEMVAAPWLAAPGVSVFVPGARSTGGT